MTTPDPNDSREIKRMMHDIDPDVTSLTTPEDRLRHLRFAVGDSVRSIQRAAAILRAMEEAGDDLRPVPAHLLNLLRRINSNLILPEVAVQLGGKLRSKVALLPLTEQRRMLDPNTVLDVVTPEGDMVAISPHRMTPAQVAQVFGDGYIRERAEQMAVLSRPKEKKKRGRKEGVTYVRIDRDRGVVEYHGHTITKSTIMRWLNEL